MFTKKHKKMLASMSEEIKQIKSLVAVQSEQIDNLRKIVEDSLITKTGEGEGAVSRSYGRVVLEELGALDKKIEQISFGLHKRTCIEESADQNGMSLLELKNDLIKLAEMLEE